MEVLKLFDAGARSMRAWAIGRQNRENCSRFYELLACQAIDRLRPAVGESKRSSPDRVFHSAHPLATPNRDNLIAPAIQRT